MASIRTSLDQRQNRTTAFMMAMYKCSGRLTIRRSCLDKPDLRIGAMCGLRILLAGLAQNIPIATCAHAGPRVVRNPTLRWLPSQNGLLADAPHLQSATRVSCLTSVWS